MVVVSFRQTLEQPVGPQRSVAQGPQPAAENFIIANADVGVTDAVPTTDNAPTVTTSGSDAVVIGLTTAAGTRPVVGVRPAVGLVKVVLEPPEQMVPPPFPLASTRVAALASTRVAAPARARAGIERDGPRRRDRAQAGVEGVAGEVSAPSSVPVLMRRGKKGQI